MKKWFKRICIGLLAFVALVIVAVNVGVSAMRFTDVDANEYFGEKGFESVIDSVLINGNYVKFVSDLPEESDSLLLVFVHGAPGTWDAFKDYIADMDLYSKARVVSYDRPGYGGSGASAMSGIQDQSEVLKQLVSHFGLKRNVLVGHSYGGPIAGITGVDINSDAVIMIAPLVDPVSEPMFWYSYFSFWKATSWLLPADFVVAGSEKLEHANQLELVKDKWQKAKGSYIHIHGLEDGLAPGKENLDFSNRHIPNEVLKTVVYDDKGHLVIWTDYKLMKAEILKVINSF